MAARAVASHIGFGPFRALPFTADDVAEVRPKVFYHLDIGGISTWCAAAIPTHFRAPPPGAVGHVKAGDRRKARTSSSAGTPTTTLLLSTARASWPKS